MDSRRCRIVGMRSPELSLMRPLLTHCSSTITFLTPITSECGNCDLSTNLQICGGNFSPVYHFNISNMHPGYPHSIQDSRQIGPRKSGQLGPAAQFALNPESLQYPQQVQPKPRISPAQARKWWNRAMTIRRVSSARRKSSHNISLQSPGTQLAFNLLHFRLQQLPTHNKNALYVCCLLCYTSYPV